MGNIIFIIVLLASIWTAAFFSLAALTWTILIGVVLLLLSFFAKASFLIIFISWVLFLVFACAANLHDLRIRYLLIPALPKLKKQLPTISETEKIAIEAGDTWWEKELFCGEPDWKQLFSIPKPILTQAEQSFLDNQVDTLCSLVDDWEAVAVNHDLSAETWHYIKKEKFWGLVIPKEYGGLGFSALAHSTIVSKIASHSASVAVTVMVPNSLGPGELILHYGTKEQKNHYLPKLAASEEIPCFALTSTDAGSDAGSITDSGIICYGEYQGKKVLGMCLKWKKRYITLAPIATVLGLAVHVYDPDKLLGSKVDLGITLCLLPTNHPGVEIGTRHYPMGLAFMNGPTSGNDVFVPLDWVIGGQDMIGQGWRMLMECLSIGRSISLPALSTGATKIIYRNTGAYARIRHQFNTALADFEGIQANLSAIAGHLYTVEATRILTVSAIDQKINPSIVSAIAKLQMTERYRDSANLAMDIHAGHMIQIGPRNFLSLLYDAAPVSITVEGANILTRNLIIFGQGAIRCHPYLLKEVALISESITDPITLDKVIMAHAGYFLRNFWKAFAYGLSGGLFIFSSMKNSRIKKYHRQLTRMSTALALLADASLILLGGNLKRRESLSARLGDILSELYLGSAVLKYFSDQAENQDQEPYAVFALQQCLYNIQKACDAFFQNFPNGWVRYLLKWIIFPFGRAYGVPTDRAAQAVVSSMTMPSVVRNQLTKYCYLSKDNTSLSARLDQALIKMEKADGIMKKLKKSIKKGEVPRWYDFTAQCKEAVDKNIITNDECQFINEFEALRKEIVQVNEFSFDLKNVIV